MPDYGKQKSGKPAKDLTRQRDRNVPHVPDRAGVAADKAALLERMKANARRGQTAGTDPSPDPDEPEVRSEGGA